MLARFVVGLAEEAGEDPALSTEMLFSESGALRDLYQKVSMRAQSVMAVEDDKDTSGKSIEGQSQSAATGALVASVIKLCWDAPASSSSGDTAATILVTKL